MDHLYACRVGEFKEGSHFDRTIHQKIVNKQYEDIRWAINYNTANTNAAKKINQLICDGNDVWVILFPNIPYNHPYAICKIYEIKDRRNEFGPLIAIGETNEERGWTNITSSGKGDFTYDIIFSKIHLLPTTAFDGEKLKGQTTFFELRNGIKNEDLFKKIKTELPFIKSYSKSLI